MTSNYWAMLGITSILSAVATVFAVKGFKYGEVSQIVPLYTFIPAMLLLTSFITLGEFPPVQGIVGVILIILGAYFVNVHHHGIHPLEPIANIAKNKGSRNTMYAVTIFSILANVDKIALRDVTPAFWMVSVIIASSLPLIPFAISKPKQERKKIRSRKKLLIATAITGGGAILAQYTAIQHTFTSYVFAIKRIDVILTIILSWIFLREHEFVKRLEGAVLMVAGAIIISLS